MRRWVPLLALAAAAACGGRRSRAPVSEPIPQALTTAGVDSLWVQAQHSVRHGRWGDAVKQLDRLLLLFPIDDPRIPHARYFLGEAHLARDEHLEAARTFRKVVDEFPDSPIAPDALLRTGDAYAEMWRRPELDPSYGQTALVTYEELIGRYPSSTAADRAKQKVADLNERFAYKTYRAARYYVRLKAYDSAILYLKDLVVSYPRASVTPDALLTLVRLYHKLGYTESADEMCAHLRQYYPGTPGTAQACRSAVVPDSTTTAAPAPTTTGPAPDTTATKKP